LAEKHPNLQAMPTVGTLKRSAQRQCNLAFINVEDSGEGKPEEGKSKLFTPLIHPKIQE